MALGLPAQVTSPNPGIASSTHNSSSLPAGAFAWLILFIYMPSSYPDIRPSQSEAKPLHSKINTFLENQKIFFRRVDFLGAFLVLAASMFLIAALQEGNLEYEWSSALIISFIVVSGLLWLAFLAWEWLVSRHDWKIQPMLPWRLAQNRVFVGVAL